MSETHSSPWRVIALVTLLLLLIGCGSAEQAVTTVPTATTALDAPPEPTDEPIVEPTETAADGAFPVTIDHKFGSTTIPAAPSRVVSIGYTDQDPLIALGVTPVAVRYWFGPTDSGVFPWAQAAFTGEEPAVMNMPFGELNYELILSYNPDLIIGVSSGITAEEYESLAQIAPTVAQSGDYENYGMPWQEALRLIATSVGKSAEAETLISDVDSIFANAIAEHPEFAGQDIVVAAGRADGGSYAFFSAQDSRTRFFTNLGFNAPADLDELTGDSFYTEISEERVELLDRDFIVFSQASYLPEGADTILNDPLLSQLDVIQQGRFVILDEGLDAAFSFGSVLSLPYAVEQLVPQMASALGSELADGDDDMLAAETRTFVDAMARTVEIPVDPQRVVVLSEIDLDSLLALGIVPVGAPNGRGQTTLPSYLIEQIDGQTTSLGALGEPNLEMVASLAPDLIVYSDPYGALAEMIPEMEQIAPVVIPYVYTDSWDWKVVFAAIADAVDKSADADAFLAAYDAQAAELGAQLPDELREVSIVRWMADGPRILLSNAFSSQVLADVGFERPAAQLDLAGSHPVHTDVINMEQIQVVDAPVVFAGGLNPEGDEVMQEALENPLVQTFESVQNGRLFTVDGLAWSSTGGPLAALDVLADVATFLQTVAE